jgi:hypothetical protein
MGVTSGCQPSEVSTSSVAGALNGILHPGGNGVLQPMVA